MCDGHMGALLDPIWWSRYPLVVSLSQGSKTRFPGFQFFNYDTIGELWEHVRLSPDWRKRNYEIAVAISLVVSRISGLQTSSVRENGGGSIAVKRNGSDKNLQKYRER